MTDVSKYLPRQWHVQQSAIGLAIKSIPVFPCGEDKSPITQNGFHAAVTDQNQVQAWFDTDNRMIGVPMGEITCLDIDAKHQAGLIDDFEQACVDAGLATVIELMPKQLTINGGCHFFLKVKDLSDPIGNTKIAKNESKETIIETRGKGGYVIVAPSKGYEFVRGSIDSVPTVTLETWQKIKAVGESFNKIETQSQVDAPRLERTTDGTSPGDEYNARGDLLNLLQRHGWKPNSDFSRWTRPGKDSGVSATWNSAETPNKFYVFSSNADPFEDGRSYSPFAVFAMLEHGGDFTNATKALTEIGYGSKGAELSTHASTMADRFLEAQRIKNAKIEAGESIDEPEDEEPCAMRKLYDEIQGKQYDESTPVKPIPAVLSLGDTPVIRRGNISTLTAQTGAGKTHVLSSIIRTLSTGERSLGFEGQIDGQIAYLDFEQSHDDFDHAMRYQAKAGAHVKAYHLTGYGWKKARMIIEAILTYESDLSVLIIDGYADCVKSVNDDVDCAEFVADLLYAAQYFNICVLGVLHLNPGSDFKSRGHLGSELDRKSETVMQINQEGEVREIWTSKARKKRINKGDGVRFQWCEEEKGFVELEGTNADAKKLIESEEAKQILKQIIDASDMWSWKHSGIVSQIKEVTNKSESTAKRLLKIMLEAGHLTHSGSTGVYTASPKLVQGGQNSEVVENKLISSGGFKGSK